MNMKKLINKGLATLVFVTAIVQPLCGMESTAHIAPDVTPLVEKVDTYVNTCVERGLFNGSVLIAKHGTILINKSYGMADFEHHIPCSPTTKFRLGSITKQFTAMAIMILQEQGRLNIKNPISRYIPLTEFPLGERVTIYHCLTNTPGLQDYLNCPNSNFRKTNEALKFHTATEIIASFKDAPLEFEPGTQYKYCNSGWILLTSIIERISGMSYEEFLRSSIFGPIGMTNTCIDSQQRDIESRACGYTRDFYNTTNYGIVPAKFVDMSCAQGAGILLSTIEDMYLWDRALYTERLVSRASLATLFTPFKEDYACGWVATEIFGKKVVCHNGGIDGCATCFFRFIDDDVCVIVLSNLDTINQNSVCFDLAAMLFEQPYSVPQAQNTIPVDPVILDSYVGNYKFNETVTITVTKEANRLFTQLTGQNIYKIHPVSETRFFVQGEDAQVSFVKNELNQVTQLILHQDGNDSVAEKI